MPLQYVKIILYFLAVDSFMIFFLMTGFIVTDFFKRINVHMDAISLLYLLYNFAAVGSVCIFFIPAPLALKQVRSQCAQATYLSCKQ